MKRITAYNWPGNVRELKSALEYAAVVKENGPILPEHLPSHIGNPAAENCTCCPAEPEAVIADEKQELISALTQSGGNKSKAARLLGVSRGTVHNRMRKYSIEYRIHES